MSSSKVPLEHQEAVALVAKMTELGIGPKDFAHIPNEGMRSPKAGRDLKEEGLQRGISDYLIFKKIPDRPDVRGVALELKRRNAPKDENGEVKISESGGLKPDQAEWLDAFRYRHGWLANCCAGAKEAYEWLLEIGYEEQDQE